MVPAAAAVIDPKMRNPAPTSLSRRSPSSSGAGGGTGKGGGAELRLVAKKIPASRKVLPAMHHPLVSMMMMMMMMMMTTTTTTTTMMMMMSLIWILPSEVLIPSYPET
jgi:hypothetical protein